MTRSTTDHRHERHGVEQERGLRPPHRDHDAGQERAQRPTGVELGAVERDRPQEQLPGHQLHHEGLPDGRVHAAQQTRPRRPAPADHGHRGRAAGHHAPTTRRRRTAWATWAQIRSARRGKRSASAAPGDAHHHERQVLEEAGQAHLAGAPGELEHHVGNGGVLHPPPRVGDEGRRSRTTGSPVARRASRGRGGRVVGHRGRGYPGPRSRALPAPGAVHGAAEPGPGGVA